MASNSSNPQDAESLAHAQLTVARQSYVTALVAATTYGMYIVLAGIALHFLLKRKGGTTGHYVSLAYTVLMLMVSTIYFVTGCKWSEVEFVETTMYPGAYATLTASSSLSTAKNAAYSVNCFLADSLILYRTYIIWQKNVFVIFIPALVYCASVATGIGTLVVSAQPDSTFGQHQFVVFGTAFWSTSVALNVLTTTLIAGKLLFHQRQMHRAQQSSQYLSLVAICVESAAVYTISGLVYIPLFALNLPQQFPFSALMGSATVIAPTLIILRVALGVAVKEDYSTRSSHNHSAARGGTVPWTGASASRTQQVSTWLGSKSEASLPTHVVELQHVGSSPREKEAF